MERKVKASGEWSLFLVLIAAGLVLLNVLSAFYYTRWDLTERRLHSLSGGTKRLLGDLDDVLTVRAYFSADLPPPFNAHERAVRDLLDEYRAASRGKMRVEIVHPSGNEELEAQAEEDGVSKVPHAALKADQAHEVLGYRGVAFLYRGESKSIPVLSRDADISGLEYAFTTTIRQVVGEKRSIGFTAGHGEPGVVPPPPRQSPMEPEPDPGISYLTKIVESYNLRELSLKARRPDPEEIRGLVVVGPNEDFGEEELYRIDQFLMQGGALAFFLNGVNVEDNYGELRASSNNLERLFDLLRGYGVQVGNDIVMDVQTDRFVISKSVRTPLGNLPMSMPVAYPGWPHFATEQIAEEHPLLYRLPGLTLLWPSTVRITREAAENEGVRAKVLARTTDQAWAQRDNFELDPAHEDERWMKVRDEAHSRGTYPVVVELTGSFRSRWAGQSPPAGAEQGGDEGEAPEHLDESRSPGRILVVGDADFLQPVWVGSQRRPRFTQSNITFMMNALDWIAEDEDLIEVRAKRLEDPSLPEMEDSKRELIKWGNILAWPVLFLIFGGVRWSMRKRAREQVGKEWSKRGGGR